MSPDQAGAIELRHTAAVTTQLETSATVNTNAAFAMAGASVEQDVLQPDHEHVVDEIDAIGMLRQAIQ